MQGKTNVRFFGVAVLAVCAAIVVVAVARIRQRKIAVVHSSEYLRRVPTRRTETSPRPTPPWRAAWTEDDAPYREARQRIDALIADGMNPDDVLMLAKRDYQLSQSESGAQVDPLITFRQSYASYRAREYIRVHILPELAEYYRPDKEREYESKLIEQLNKRFAIITPASPPHNYEYARLMFLAGGMDYVDHGKEKVLLGERLLKKNPHDVDVKAVLVEALVRANVPQNVRREYAQKAVRYAVQITHAEPDSPRSWRTLATAYRGFSPANGERDDDEKLRQYAEEYAPRIELANRICLALAPADYGQRLSTNTALKELQQRVIKHPLKQVKRGIPAYAQGLANQRPSRLNFYRWNMDDTPFRKIRTEIDRKIASGTDPEILLQAAKQDNARKNQKRYIEDYEAAFRFGYASYRAAEQTYYRLSPKSQTIANGVLSADFSATPQKVKVRDIVNEEKRRWVDNQRGIEMFYDVYAANSVVVESLAPINSYEFARLSLLLLDMTGGTSSEGWGIVSDIKMLQKRAPHDIQIQDILARELAESADLADQQTAIHYAQELASAQPASFRSYETLGTVYRKIAHVPDPADDEPQENRKFRKGYAAKSLAAYRKCLELAPHNYAPRLDIRHEIALIQNSLNA